MVIWKDGVFSDLVLLLLSGDGKGSPLQKFTQGMILDNNLKSNAELGYLNE